MPRRQFLAGCLGAAASLAIPGAPAAASARRPFCWLMIEADEILKSQGAAPLLALCRQADGYGYNGLWLWDSNLWDRLLPDDYQQTTTELQEGLGRLNWTLHVEMCGNHGSSLVSYTGDPTIVEPHQWQQYHYTCLSHPRVHEIWEEQLVRAKRLYAPIGWHLWYDEIRVAGVCDRCRASGKTTGQLLTEHARKTIAMFRRVSPGTLLSVWNDMFDPYINAKRPYYNVKEGFEGTWNAIDRDILIINYTISDELWERSRKSLSFWARRGNRQIVAGYYDHASYRPEPLNAAGERRLIRRAQSIPGLAGFMYSTWRNQFDHLQEYLVRDGWA